MDAMLSTSEVAELTGISLRHVKRLAASNKLPCEKTVNSNNRPKYLFPLSGLAALDPTLPQRYLAQHAQEGTAEGAAEPQNAKRGRGRPRKGGAGKTAASKPLEEYSTEERGENAFWTQAVQDWRGYRAGYRDKAAADEAWLAQFRLDHPEVHITRKILYARQRAVLEDDLDGLVDGRGKARRGTARSRRRRGTPLCTTTWTSGKAPSSNATTRRSTFWNSIARKHCRCRTTRLFTAMLWWMCRSP